MRFASTVAHATATALLIAALAPPAFAATTPKAPQKSSSPAPKAPASKHAWKPNVSALPPGSTVVKIENLDGVVLVPATLTGASGRDTSGLLVVDTGAGFLAVDHSLVSFLDLEGNDPAGGGLGIAKAPLGRLEIGSLQIDQSSPVLLLDADIVRRATGRDVLGLAGQRVFEGRALWIDFDAERLACLPSPPDTSRARDEASDSDTAADSLARIRAARSREVLRPLLSRSAEPVPFRLAGDNKILIEARLGDDPSHPGQWSWLVFDTGATKSVLFEPAFGERCPGAERWKSLTGLVAPTLVGSAAARLTLVPRFELATADTNPVLRQRVDCAVITTPLAEAISNAVGDTVIGIIGYSFFKQDRVAIDYPNRVLWLDPVPDAKDSHPYEFSHVGLQLERDGDHIRVLGIAGRSPAEQAGIAVGDTLVAVGTRSAHAGDLVTLTEMLEGPPGTALNVTLLRDGQRRTYKLVRRQLL